ncbi:hypothetical protein ALMP_25450 [Streptomyces sp. A012304]|nr:hypothetical protein ALMP_25450 [Streptomyces sp. A012304]
MPGEWGARGSSAAGGSVAVIKAFLPQVPPCADGGSPTEPRGMPDGRVTPVKQSKLG